MLSKDLHTSVKEPVDNAETLKMQHSVANYFFVASTIMITYLFCYEFKLWFKWRLKRSVRTKNTIYEDVKRYKKIRM